MNICCSTVELIICDESKKFTLLFNIARMQPVQTFLHNFFSVIVSVCVNTCIHKQLSLKPHIEFNPCMYVCVYMFLSERES